MTDAIPKLPVREYPEPAKREPLSKFDFAQLFLFQGGKCAKCWAKLERGKVRDEHLHALHLGGGNELSNRQLWCLACTKPKDKADKKLIAKGKRIRGETCTGPKRAIANRGFPKNLRKKMNGTVERVGS